MINYSSVDLTNIEKQHRYWARLRGHRRKMDKIRDKKQDLCAASTDDDIHCCPDHSVFATMSMVGKFRGTARVVNYAGLVRGKTQRIIKMEDAGQEEDAMIDDVAAFIDGLKREVIR